MHKYVGDLRVADVMVRQADQKRFRSRAYRNNMQTDCADHSDWNPLRIRPKCQHVSIKPLASVRDDFSYRNINLKRMYA